MNLQWVKQIGNSTLITRPFHCTDVLGNLYICGSFQGVLDVDPGIGVITITSTPSNDVFISKLDPAGNFLWAKQIGGASTEIVNAIKTDLNGNVLITGAFASSSVDFDPGPGTFILNNTTAGQLDVFILKLDASGNFTWAKQLSSVTNENAYGMTVDGFNNVYITGYATMLLDYDPGPGTYTIQSTGTFNIFVLKLDGSGNFLWAVQTNSLSTSLPTDVTVDNSGNVYAVGQFAGAGDFDSGPASYTLAALGSSDAYIIKLNSSGTFLWAKQLGGTGGDAIDAIALNNSGDVFLTGHYSNVVDFDLGPAVFTATSNGGYDVFLYKLDTNGNFGWVKTFGSIDDESTNSIVLDGSANLYISGVYRTPLDIDPGPIIYPVSSIGSFDVFISKFDGSGTLIWTKQFGGINSESSPILVLDPTGNLYCCGLFTNKVDFDPGPLTDTISSNGNNVASQFLSKFSGCTAPINPVNTSNGNNLTLCSGQNASLSAIGTGTINWYTPSYSLISVGNNLVTPSLTAGTYTYYAENDSLCSSLQRAVIVVTVNPRPSISLDGISSICIGSSVTQSLSGANSYTWNTGSNSNTQVFTPSVSTTYSVVGTNSFGCTNSIVKTITVNPLPVITVIGNTFICLGTPLIQGVNGASTFTWITSTGVFTTNAGAISNTVIVNPSVTTVYTISGHDNNNCFNSITRTINARPPANLSVGYPPLNVCKNQDYKLYANGTATYYWNTGDTDSVLVVNLNAASFYTVTGTTNGCSATRTFSLDVIDCTGIEETDTKFNEIVLYPNPSNGIITIHSKSYSQDCTFKIYSTTGELILSGQYLEEGNLIDLRSQPKGLYYVMIIMNGKQTVKKIIKM